MVHRPGYSTSKLILLSIAISVVALAGCMQVEVTAPTPTPTLTSAIITSTPAFQPTPLPEPTFTAQPTSLASPTVVVIELPPSAMITGITGHEQTYELGCETSAAVDWAGYYDVLIYESTFQFDLPLSDNPELGFVGNVTTDGWGQIPPDAYGVHAAPVAELLREYGLSAQAVRGMTLEEVKDELAEGDPIIAWVIGNMVFSSPVKYVDKEGNAVTVAPYEHVVILTGYDEKNIFYMNNGNFFSIPIDVFLTSWGVLGNMAVIYD